MKRFLSITVAALVAVVTIGSSFGGVASAQSRGLGITPRRDLVIQPGKSVTDQVTVNNLNNSEPLNLSLEIVDFGAQDETGTPALELDPEADQTPWSLKPFIKAPTSLTVAPGESEVVKFTVTIPADQGAGSYYSAIRYSAEGGDGGQVGLSASGATLVFTTVPGKTKESLITKKFGAYESKGTTNGSYRSLFVSKQPSEMAFTLKNQGNVAEQPAGSILVKNMFGKQSLVIKDANPKSSLALIGQDRRFQVCMVEQKSDTDVTCKPASLTPGRYTASLSLFYGINGNQTQEIAATASFWYLPVWFLVVVGVVLLAIVIAGYMLYRRFTGGRGFKKR